MRRIGRKLMHLFYRPLVRHYLKKDRHYKSNGLKLIIKKSVFHPAFFGSTKVFLAFLRQQNVSGLSALEIGCGSGLLSLVMAQKRANVTGIDIDPVAVECSRMNAIRNGLSIHFLQSDLFVSVLPQTFNIISVNPPYFEGTVSGDGTSAWYSGIDLDFFRRFFNTVSPYTHSRTRIWMILSEVCDLEKIHQIAEEANYSLHTKYSEIKNFELFTVYEIHSSG